MPNSLKFNAKQKKNSHKKTICFQIKSGHNQDAERLQNLQISA